ncbi:MAG: M23 family metallopeptidase [Armatimonadota bacterium]
MHRFTDDFRRLLCPLSRKSFFSLCVAVTAGSLCAAAPSFAQTPLSDEIVKARGRSAANLIARRDSAALFARFTPEMVRAISQEQLRGLIEQVISDQTPLGSPITETVREQGGGIRAYVGEYRWRADRNLYLTFAFSPDATDKIAGMRIRPADEREAAVRKLGRDTVALIAAKNGKALFARFTPELAAKVPESTLQSVLDSTLTSNSPLGVVVSDDVEPAEDGYIRYSAVHRWRKEAKQNLSVAVTFEAGGSNRIAGLALRPELPQKPPTDPKAGYKQKARLMLPFAPGDEWYVAWGGGTRVQNYHVDYPNQRHALDLLVRKEGKTHSGEGKETADYYAWGRQIAAPAPGTVVGVVDNLPDNKPGVTTDTRNPAGNHVVLDLGSGEYALLAHLQKGSVRVKVGDAVKPGDVLGLCGNSGNSTEPHLHFHLQDRPKFTGDAVSLPVSFSAYSVNGKKAERGSPVRGQYLKQP